MCVSCSWFRKTFSLVRKQRAPRITLSVTWWVQMTSPNVVVIMFWHLLLVLFQFDTNITHKITYIRVCVCVCEHKVKRWVMQNAVAVAASDSIPSAHMYHESLWSEALNHSSIYSISSFFAVAPDNRFASPVTAISSHSFTPDWASQHLLRSFFWLCNTFYRLCKWRWGNRIEYFLT